MGKRLTAALHKLRQAEVRHCGDVAAAVGVLFLGPHTAARQEKAERSNCGKTTFRRPSLPSVSDHPDLASLVRQVERLSPALSRPDEFFERKSAILKDMRRLVAADRAGRR